MAAVQVMTSLIISKFLPNYVKMDNILVSREIL